MTNSSRIHIGSSRSKVFYMLSLMRPANVLTSATNILAGIALAGFVKSASFYAYPIFEMIWSRDVLLLLISGCALYAGSVVFNDVFDVGLDIIERPERALPSGKVSIKEATALGTILLTISIVASFNVNYYSGFISILISLFALLYNYKSKHYKVLGPMNMGLCRALNLCLGISILPSLLYSMSLYSIVPLLYIIAITLISHGEVKGGNKNSLMVALLLYVCLLSVVVYLHINSCLFVLIWAIIIFPPLVKALKTNAALAQRSAVKAGVLAVVLMDASLASGFAGFYYSIFIVLFLPLSMFIGRKFQIT